MKKNPEASDLAARLAAAARQPAGMSSVPAPSLTALLGNCTVQVSEMESLCPPPLQPRARMAP